MHGSSALREIDTAIQRGDVVKRAKGVPRNTLQIFRGTTPSYKAEDDLRRGFRRQEGGLGATGEEVLAQVDAGAAADAAAAARQPLLGLAAAGAVQVGQQLDVGLALALGRQRSS